MKNLYRSLALCIVLVGVTFPATSLLFGQTVTPTTSSYSFGSINVCAAGKTAPAPCSANHTLSFDVPAGTTIGSIAIVLGGTPDLDFTAQANDTRTTLCTAKTYTAETTCTVDVTFTPLAPGARNGAVEILDGSGNLLAMTYVYGIGVAPQITFNPAPPIIRHGASGGNGQLAVDGAGNIYISLEGGISEIMAASGYSTIKNLTVNLPNFSIQSLAVDGAGNLFVTVGNQPAVQEILAVGGYTTVKTLLTNSTDFGYLAVDGSGNVFVPDFFDSKVQEIEADGGYTTVKNIGSGFNLLQAVAVDAAGNLFVLDDAPGTFNGVVKEILAAGGYTTIKVLGNGSDFVFAVSLAVDAASNVFVAADGSLKTPGSVFEIPAAGGYAKVDDIGVGVAKALGGSSLAPAVLAVDGYGDVFMNGSGGINGIIELQRSKPPALAFAPANVNTTSKDSPLSVTVQNSGNALLTGSDLAFNDDDFAQAAGTGAPPDCTATFSLAVGAQCNLSVDFVPVSGGALSGSAVLTDNSGNATAATQSIALSGNGLAPGGPVAHLSATTLNYGNLAYPGTATKSLTITNTGGGTLTVSPSINGPAYKITGNTCTAGVTTGSCSLQVEFDPIGLNLQTNHLTLATNGPTNPRAFLTGTGTGIGAYGAYFPLEPITSIDFGTIALPSAPNIAEFIVNDTGVPLPVTVKTSIDNPYFKVTRNDCIQGVTADGGYCRVFVEFTPITLGSKVSTLTLKPSVGPTSTITLRGTAIGTLP
jgi:hypothetical protein